MVAPGVIRPTTTSLKYLGTVPGIAAGATPTMQIKMPQTIHRLMFVCRDGGVLLTRAQMITDIGGYEVQINGETIFNPSMTQHLDLYKYHFDKFGALAAPLGTAIIPFVRSNLPVWDLNREFGLGMLRNSGSGLNEVTVRITLNAGLTNLDQMDLWAEYDLYDSEPTGAHVRTLLRTDSFAGTGEQHISTLPHSQTGVLAYHFVGVVPGTGTMTFISVTKNGRFVFDHADTSGMLILQDLAGRTPQTNYYHIAFDLSNDLNGFERLGGDTSWILRPTWTVAPGVGYSIIAEEIWDGVPG